MQDENLLDDIHLEEIAWRNHRIRRKCIFWAATLTVSYQLTVMILVLPGVWKGHPSWLILTSILAMLIQSAVAFRIRRKYPIKPDKIIKQLNHE